MALYAYDEDGILTYAADAKAQLHYYCCECHLPVLARKAFRRIPHFYHRKLSPSCRLYGKSQDHLFAQLALQKLLPDAVLEKPFPSILRIGDVVWEPHKLVFEVQCSRMAQSEAEARVNDYASVGYQVVWILDDRIFNRRVARPTERWMRQGACYFATLRGRPFPRFYDQFEIFAAERRAYRGQRLLIRVDQPQRMPEVSWDPDAVPQQVPQRGAPGRLYFEGDLCHKALLAQRIAPLATVMQNLRILELSYRCKAMGPWKVVSSFLAETLGRLMHFLQKANERY